MNVNQCTKCQLGSILVGDACVSCAIEGCLRCDTDVNKCTNCDDGYTEMNGTCHKCRDNCTCSFYPGGTEISDCSGCVSGHNLT